MSAYPVLGCGWDRDTLAVEAKGMPDYVAAITDRLEHNPPLFYEMRLTRVSAELIKNPTVLAGYDDSCVACDHLGRGDEAVAWMDKKRVQLALLNPNTDSTKTEWYHYWANIGTARAHRWLRAGANRQEMDEFKKARAEIAEAIKVNPEAHFGREVDQLAFMDWVIDPASRDELGKAYLDSQGHPYTDSLCQRIANSIHDGPGNPGTRKAILGLIVQGNASDSLDLMAALSESMATEVFNPKTRIADLASLRCGELYHEGGRSLGVAAQPGDWSHWNGNATDDFSVAYRKMRGDANTWKAHRTSFMLNRLRNGRHPDTDSTFWWGYTESPPLYSSWNPTGNFKLMTPDEKDSVYVRFAILGAVVLVGVLVARLIYNLCRDFPARGWIRPRP